MTTQRDTTRFASTTVDSPVGRLHLLGTVDGLAAVLWPDLERELARIRVSPDQLIEGDVPVFDLAKSQLRAYFAGERTEFDLPLDPQGTEFQLSVWSALRKIPFGVTSSYGKQARMIDKPRAVRAVASANARNPISIVVPCHRVIGANGSLTGFAGGLDAKSWLLEHERAG